MQDIEVMEAFEAEGDLNEGLPNVPFLEILFVFLLIKYLLIQVAIIGKLHHYA